MANAPKSNYVKLEGYINWMFVGDEEGYSKRVEVQSAHLRRDGNELAITCECPRSGAPPYIVRFLLRRESPLVFRGPVMAATGRREARPTGHCDCSVYFNGSRLALVGTWRQKVRRRWMAELWPRADANP